MTDRISVPGRCHFCRMRLVQADMTDLWAAPIDDECLIRLLQHHQSVVGEFEGYSPRPTLVARRRIAEMRQRHFPKFLDRCRGLRLENRISVIANQLHVVTDAALPPR